ncbi:MAG TPA: hypothetical protein V6C71_08550 [Coleofasciculaceae cyanobacterium]
MVKPTWRLDKLLRVATSLAIKLGYRRTHRELDAITPRVRATNQTSSRTLNQQRDRSSTKLILKSKF